MYDTIIYRKTVKPAWRERLVDYNDAVTANPDGLLPAYQLYTNPVYQRLVDTFGLNSVFILSAGWGLIRSRKARTDWNNRRWKTGDWTA